MRRYRLIQKNYLQLPGLPSNDPPAPAPSQSVKDRNLKLGFGQNSRLNQPDLVSQLGPKTDSVLENEPQFEPVFLDKLKATAGIYSSS